MAASIGMDINPARKRGAITRFIGSTAIISMPESCSVAFIRPISAVSAEPARPANSSAVTTGPSSRTSDSAGGIFFPAGSGKAAVLRITVRATRSIPVA